MKKCWGPVFHDTRFGLAPCRQFEDEISPLTTPAAYSTKASLEGLATSTHTSPGGERLLYNVSSIPYKQGRRVSKYAIPSPETSFGLF